jgi:lipopolysaccharide biosynthesis regulator YciM
VHVEKVTVNCIFITFDQFTDHLTKRATERAQQGQKGDTEASREATFIYNLLKNPEDAYQIFAERARSYTQDLNRVAGTMETDVVKDAATGKNQGPQRALAALNESNVGAAAVASFALKVAELLEAQGDLAGARTALEQALQRSPTNGALLRRYAVVLFETGKSAAAITKLTDVIDRNETNNTLSSADLAWIHTALGQVLQGIGNLDAANERFRSARQMAGLALREGSFSRADLGWVLNDSAGASIRRNELKRAEESLCRAIDEFKAELGSIHRATLIAELNLSVVWRRMGRWGDARALAEQLRARISSEPALVQLHGYLTLIVAQAEFYLGLGDQAAKSLDSAEAYFSPLYNQTGAHAQRLGRIKDFRAHLAFWNEDWNEAIDQTRAAKKLFAEAYGVASFDGLSMEFWELLGLVELRSFDLAKASLEQFRSDLRQLRLDQDRTWLAYARLLEAFLKSETGDTRAVRSEIELTLATLFEIERSSESYETLADGAIYRMLRLGAGSANKIGFGDVRDYRLARGARTALLEATNVDCKNP